MLDDRKLKCIELLALGTETKTDIAKIVGVSRQAIYDWLDDAEFKAELDRRLQQRKVWGEKKLESMITKAVDRIWEEIETTDNSRVRAELLKYIVDRALGRVPMKADVTVSPGTQDNQERETFYQMLEEETEEE
ncbi:hypothetical protein H0A61_02161 [Koleobacter methoxysyntrophicus]|uniref:Insertion element IS150 protein InsJ-like helix-turn-helix domain-containing protein n=1 Tax=Koleobacter methoxysyntrophicus TaxID=2751313 RepID=A0A8A0RQD2_9FIRM|nr:helix-turn-helix domain-containing protein [Koleobacter methoxysyntrophicus]QSQ09780.1 hypothetical protein H0A61_02161 [Koleobacter methoxysyntrophicus]